MLALEDTGRPSNTYTSPYVKTQEHSLLRNTPLNAGEEEDIER